MTLKEAILKSLSDLKKTANYLEVCEHVTENGLYDFKDSKTPASTVSALLGDFIRKGDSRVKRVKIDGGGFVYYLSKDEDVIEIENLNETPSKLQQRRPTKSFAERDLHILLSTYLSNTGVFAKTIFHEQSKNSKDSHQKWIHPDMVGIKFLNLQNLTSQAFLKSVARADTFKIFSYEIKKEINTDYELKKSFFQAVSNSSWANFGYLVAFEISDSLYEEMERLSQSFGIGIIELNPNPYESKILYQAKYKDLDFKTLDKLCKINVDFERFIGQTEKLLNATDRYFQSTMRELEEFCDACFKTDSEIEDFCNSHGISKE